MAHTMRPAHCPRDRECNRSPAYKQRTILAGHIDQRMPGADYQVEYIVHSIRLSLRSHRLLRGARSDELSGSEERRGDLL